MFIKNWIEMCIKINSERREKIKNGTWTKDEQRRLEEAQRSIDRQCSFIEGRWVNEQRQ